MVARACKGGGGQELESRETSQLPFLIAAHLVILERIISRVICLAVVLWILARVRNVLVAKRGLHVRGW